MYKHKWKMAAVFQHLIFLHSSTSHMAGYIVGVYTCFYIRICETALLNKIILFLFSPDPCRLAKLLMESS